jgi:hypothetical protein
LIVVSNSWKIWLAGMAVSLGIFLVVYFTVIKDANDTADQALQNATQQEQQLLNNANEELDKASQDAQGAAQGSLSDAEKLTNCIADAGTDTGKIADCQAQFGG